MAQGSAPSALDSSAAAAASSRAACRAPVRAAAARKVPPQDGAIAAIAKPHSPSAAAWLSRVGEGGTL